jgi:hypothetical protein
LSVQETKIDRPTVCDSATEKECQDPSGRKVCFQKDLCQGITTTTATTGTQLKQSKAGTASDQDWWKK